MFKQAAGEDYIIFNGPDEQLTARRPEGRDEPAPSCPNFSDELVKRGEDG